MVERSGEAIGVSMAIGMAVFILAAASMLLFLQDASSPHTGFDQQTAAAAERAIERFQSVTDWTVYKTQIAVHTDQALVNEPLELNTVLSSDTNPDSVLVMQNGNELPSQYSDTDGETVIITNLSAGLTTLDLIHTKDSGIDARDYDTSLEHAGNSTWNQDLNVTADSTGFSDITFKDLTLLEDAASLGVSASPSFTTGAVRTTFTYPDADETTVRVFDRSGHIRINQEFTGQKTWEFNLTSNFTEMYAAPQDDTFDLDQSGTIFNDTAAFVDFYDVYGFGIAGEDLFVNVSRDDTTSPINVRIEVTEDNGEQDILLYAHEGNYTEALPAVNGFLEPYVTAVGVAAPVTGISRERASSLEDDEYEDVRAVLGLTGSDFNLTVDTVFQHGQSIPRGTVRAHEFPAPIVERYANATITTMRLRVW